MGVEAARAALRPLDGRDARTRCGSPRWRPPTPTRPTPPPIHAALRLGPTSAPFDADGSVRSAIGALHAALERPRHAPRGERRPADRAGRRARRGRLRRRRRRAASSATSDDGPVLAELLGGGWATEEFLDRWRTPGDARSKVWEERFGETRYVPLGQAAWDDALKTAGLVADQVDHVVVAGPHARANARAGQEARPSATAWSTTWPAPSATPAPPSPPSCSPPRSRRPSPGR